MIDLLTRDYGPDSRNRLADTTGEADEAALAALETFYFALNHADLDALAAVWADDPLAQLDNPVAASCAAGPRSSRCTAGCSTAGWSSRSPSPTPCACAHRARSS